MEVRERVKALCGQLSRWPSVRETVREGAAEGALDELLTLLRGREEPDPARLEELLDTIGRAAAERGLPGLTSRVRGPIPALPHGMPACPKLWDGRARWHAARVWCSPGRARAPRCARLPTLARMP
ncbi:hypothetical protein WKI71_04605 [Streptomyces sp. MS1.AVA.1]|uniref:Uncharacterized protein n=1 Tax=Streptomyces machairae TaxID=3134109 RepID=A0ABU8UGX2_9ACTN